MSTFYYTVQKNLVKGLWEGIQSLAGWLWDKVSDWASDLWDGICDFFGIHSPSKKFAEMGEYMSMGLGEGFVSEMNSLEKDIENSIPSDFNIDANARIRSVAYDTDPVKVAAASTVNATANAPISADNTQSGDLREGLSLLRQANGILQRILEKDTSISIGDEQIGQANTRYTEKRGVVLNTGGFANAY